MILTYIAYIDSYSFKSETTWFSSKITMDPYVSFKPCVQCFKVPTVSRSFPDDWFFFQFRHICIIFRCNPISQYVISYCGIDELLLRTVNTVQIWSSCCTRLTYFPPPSHCVMPTSQIPSASPSPLFSNLPTALPVHSSTYIPKSLSMIFIVDIRLRHAAQKELNSPKRFTNLPSVSMSIILY